MEWPIGLRCDLVEVPLESCCGVIAHLYGLGLEACPVAQVGNRLLFLVADCSTPTLRPNLDGLPPGLVTHQAVDDLPDLEDVNRDGCWVIQAPNQVSGLPSASVIVAAVRSAYAEYQAARAGSV